MWGFDCMRPSVGMFPSVVCSQSMPPVGRPVRRLGDRIREGVTRVRLRQDPSMFRQVLNTLREDISTFRLWQHVSTLRPDRRVLGSDLSIVRQDLSTLRSDLSTSFLMYGTDSIRPAKTYVMQTTRNHSDQKQIVCMYRVAMFPSVVCSQFVPPVGRPGRR